MDVADEPTAYDVSELLAAHPVQVDGAEMKDWYDARGIQYGPAFTGLATAHTTEGPGGSVLAEVALPGSIRSQQGAYAVHPALLDACFQAVGAHPDLHADTSGALMLPLGVARLRAHASTRNAHYCYVRLTSASAAAVEADIEVLDEQGAVLLSVTGLRLGTGVSEAGRRDRTLNERLLTIDWRQQEPPVADDSVEPGSWLVVSTVGRVRHARGGTGRSAEAQGGSGRRAGVAATRGPRSQRRAPPCAADRLRVQRRRRRHRAT